MMSTEARSVPVPVPVWMTGGHSLAGLEAGPAQGLVVSLNEAALDVGVAHAAAEMPRVPIPADDQEEDGDDDE